MIKQRFGQCIDCGPDSADKPLYSKERCYSHYWRFRHEENLSKKNTKNSLVNQTLNQAEKKALQYWFTYHIEHSGNNCENCGEHLHFSTRDIAYSCQAHILPKSLFPSVKAELNNHMTLGGLYQLCSCHGQFDTNWMNAEKMPVFKIAVERFLLFKNKIDKIELHRLPEPFIKYL